MGLAIAKDALREFGLLGVLLFELASLGVIVADNEVILFLGTALVRPNIIEKLVLSKNCSYFIRNSQCY
jgi:hypothetical protein